MTKTDLANNISVRLNRLPVEGKECSHCVIEVTPTIRNRLVIAGKIYLEYDRCRLNDRISVPTCYKCQVYGRVSKNCEATTDICMHCAEDGHIFKDCPNKKAKRKCGAHVKGAL
ncbi:hypothetical protein QAD02_010424 [Eretmocerus hayati]|uniref:Uncharacterized protein n=1 Tax=Eretmocerus hayati TaxID=131215 RepID=A0ACC2NUU8_9HYME|nr:hypothetical protein QAD02_010424 [Eretmocerus hayati]